MCSYVTFNEQNREASKQKAGYKMHFVILRNTKFTEKQKGKQNNHIAGTQNHISSRIVVLAYVFLNVKYHLQLKFFLNTVVIVFFIAPARGTCYYVLLSFYFNFLKNTFFINMYVVVLL